MLFFLTIFFLLLAVVFLGYARQERAKRLRVEQRMTVLEARINPHFFSNSLNAIEALINLGQKREAAKYLIHFSHLLRKTLRTAQRETISLATEIQISRHYLALEQLRFKDKITCTVELGTDLRPKSLAVPALCLQPLLEEALWQRILPREQIGSLRLEIKREGSQLCCIITDNGRRVRQQSSESLQSQAGDDRGAVVPQKPTKREYTTLKTIDLYDKNGANAGTQVTLCLPLKNYEL